MRVELICSDQKHPVQKYLHRLREELQRDGVECLIATRKEELAGGDMLFMVSCQEIIDGSILGQYKGCYVLHASDLPEGRGWSPHVWQIVEGRNALTVTLLEAAERVDTGGIVGKESIKLTGNELYYEIESMIYEAEVSLIRLGIDLYPDITSQPQASNHATYYRKRTPEDSRLDVHKSLADQFDLLRVANPERYPAFFEHRERRYRISLEVMEDLDEST